MGVKQVLALWVVLFASVSTASGQRLGPRVEREGVSVRFVRPEVNDVASTDWRATVQGLEGTSVVLALQRGEGYRNYDQGRRTPTRVCGRAATKIVLQVPRVEAIPGFIGEDGSYSHGPPSITEAHVHVGLLFEHGGVPFLVLYRVDAAHRQRHRALERAFLSSVRCGP